MWKKLILHKKEAPVPGSDSKNAIATPASASYNDNISRQNNNGNPFEQRV